jgi:rubrerythrin
VAVSIVFSILRAIRSSGRDVLTTTPVNQQTVKETEIIREIVKIRCSYCGNLYDETEDKCPHCGAPKHR